MGKKLIASGEYAPTAVIKREGAMLKGVYLGKRGVETQYGTKNVYSFKVLDAECEFTSGGNTVEPEAGTAVDVFAPTLLDRQLSQAKEGQTITIKYAGLGKKVKGRNAPHTFDVEAE